MADGLSLLPTQQSGPGPTDAPLATFQSYSAFTTSVYDFSTTITRIAYDPLGVQAPTQIIQTQAVATTSIGYTVVYRPLLYTGPFPAPPLGTLYTTAGEVLITPSAIAPPQPTRTVSTGSSVSTLAPGSGKAGGGGDNAGGSSSTGPGTGGQPIVTSSQSLGPAPTPAPTFITSSTINPASDASIQSSLASEASVGASNAAASASQASFSASNASQSSAASLSSASASSAASSAFAQSASASSLSASASASQDSTSMLMPMPTATNGVNPTTRPSGMQYDLSAGQIAGIVIGSVLALLLLLLLCLLSFRRRRRYRNGGEEGGAIAGRDYNEKWSSGLSRGGKRGIYAAIGGGAAAAATRGRSSRSDELEEDNLSGGDGSGFLVVGGRRLEGGSRTSLPRTDPNAQSAAAKGALAGLGAGIAAKFATKKSNMCKRHDAIGGDWDHEDGELDRMIASDEDGDADGDVTNGGRGLMSFDIGQDTSDILHPGGVTGWTTPPSLVPGHQEYSAVNNTSSSPQSEAAWLTGMGAISPQAPPSYTEQSDSTQSNQRAAQPKNPGTGRIPSFNGSFGEGDLGLVQHRGDNRNSNVSGPSIGAAAAALGSLGALAAGHRDSSITTDNHGSENGHSAFISKDSILLGPNASQGRSAGGIGGGGGGSRLPLGALASSIATSQDDESSNSSNVRSRQRRYEDSSGSTGAASYSPSYLARQTTSSTRGGSSNNNSLSSRDVARGGSSNSSSGRSRRQRQGHTDASGGASSYYPESDAQSSRATAGGVQDDQGWSVDPHVPLQSVQESQEDQGNITGHYYPSDSLGAAMQRRTAQESQEGANSSWRPSPRVQSFSQRAAAAANMNGEEGLQQLSNNDDTPLLASESRQAGGRSRDRGLLDRFLRPT